MAAFQTGWKGALITGLVTWIVQAVLVAMFLDPSYLQDQIAIERSSVTHWWGDSTDKWLVRHVNTSYQRIGPTVNRLLPKSEAANTQPIDRSDEDPVIANMAEVSQSLRFNLTQSLLRFHMATFWTVPTLILLGGALTHGWRNREIKKVAYGYTSPNRFVIGMHLLAASPFMFLIYLQFPIALPMAPMVPLFLFLGFVGAAGLVASNWQKQV